MKGASPRRAANGTKWRPAQFLFVRPSEVKLIFFRVLKQTASEGKNSGTVEGDRGPLLSQRPQTVFWPKNTCPASL